MFNRTNEELKEISELDIHGVMEELNDVVDEQSRHIECMRQYSIAMTNRFIATLLENMDEKILQMEKTIDNYKKLSKE